MSLIRPCDVCGLDSEAADRNDSDPQSCKLPLSSLSHGAERGCWRCKLLAESADKFKAGWAQECGVDEGSLEVEFHTEKPLRVFVNWLDCTGKSQTRELSIVMEASSKAPLKELIFEPEVDTDTDHESLQKEGDVPWDDIPIRRLPAPLASSSECLEFIQKQIANCQAHHEECKNFSINQLGRYARTPLPPTRLLRIKREESGELRVFLIETDDNSTYRYTALSHCWGSQEEASKIPVTTKANVAQRHEDGIPVSSLTKSFQDTIHLTQTLGATDFIWIDSICIIQDDAGDWRKECPKMASVYGNAYLVISATSASDGRGGLFRPRPQARRVEYGTLSGHSIRVAVTAKTLPSPIRPGGRRPPLTHDVWKAGDAYWTADGLPLFERAWAFQERLLARRVVHYTPTELVWECRSAAACECGDLADPSTASGEYDVGETFKTAYGRMVHAASTPQKVNFWNDIVAQYSARKLTKHSDKLAALYGVAQQLAASWGDPYLEGYACGLWTDGLPNQLMWQSEYHNTDIFPSQSVVTHRRPRSANGRSLMPSWSWMSIEGRIGTWGRSPVLRGSVDIRPPKNEGDLALLRFVGPVAELDVCAASTIKRQPLHLLYSKRSRSNKGSALRGDTRPLEFSTEQLQSSQLLALAFGTESGVAVYCLVVRKVADEPRGGCYERVGTVSFPPGTFGKGNVKKILVV